ncbi:uncharacterized protein LOC132549224 [Ylistrum balloti]|uniref:uncharacterized protein LOC132549224 n=1 Tax=Ylistrum balloti TaxID=509963 RepID=UPI002905E228|nr:uncharacterized protein LOC132549224 [Ylistrum balloti]
MEVDGNISLRLKSRMAFWIVILVFSLVLPDGVFTSHMSTIDERTGISPRDSATNTRMSSRNTRTRSGIQTAASSSRSSGRLEDQRGTNRCFPGRTCDQTPARTRSSVRTQGRVVPTSQGSQRRTPSLSSRTRVASRTSGSSGASGSSRTSASSRASVSSRARASPRTVAVSREPARTAVSRGPARTAVAVRDRVTSRGSISSRGGVANTPAREGVAVRSRLSSRSGVSSRVSSRAGGSSVARFPQRSEQLRPTDSSRSSARSSSSSGVAVRDPSSTGTRVSSRGMSRGSSLRSSSSRASSSQAGTTSRDSSRGTSKLSSRGSSVGVNRVSSRLNSGQTSSRRNTGQRSNRVQQTRTSSSQRIRGSNERSRQNTRSGNTNSGSGIVGNNVLPPSVNRFLKELKASMPASVGVGVGMSMANGASSTNTRQSSGRRSSSSGSSSSGGSGIAVNQRVSESSSRRASPGQRFGSRGPQRVISVDRIQPIIRPTFNDAGLGINDPQFAIQDNLLQTDGLISNGFSSDPQDVSVSGNNNQASPSMAINDLLSQNSLDLAVPLSTRNQPIIHNLDQFVSRQQNQIAPDIPQTFSQGPIIGIHDHVTNGRTAVGVMNDQMQTNDQRIVTDMQGIQTQTRPVDSVVSIRQNVLNTGQGQGQMSTESVAVDPILRNDQIIQGNSASNVFGHVVQSQGHSPVQQVQQSIQPTQDLSWQHQHQSQQAQPTFVNSNNEGVMQPIIGSNTMQIPQQPLSPQAAIAGIPLQETRNAGTFDLRPTLGSSIIHNIHTGVAQPAGASISIQSGNQPQQTGIQQNQVHTPVHHSGPVQQHIGVNPQQLGIQNGGLERQSLGVSQTQVGPTQVVGVNQNRFSSNINDMQQSFPIPNAPVQDLTQVQQVQGQVAQGPIVIGSPGSAGQFITPQPLDKLQSQTFQNNHIQTSGIIHQNQNVNQALNPQLISGQVQSVINNHAGGMPGQAPASHSNIQSQQQLLPTREEATFTQPLHQTVNQRAGLATGDSNTQPVSNILNSKPLNALSAHVLSRLGNAQTVHDIHRILTGQPSSVVTSNQSPTGSVGTIGGQTFHGIAPAAPVTQSPNSMSTPDPKRMVIQIDPNSKGVKIVPDGMGGVRVISLREAVTVSPFGNENRTGIMALYDTPSQGPQPPLSVPLGSVINSQTVSLNTAVNKKPIAKTPIYGEMEPEINTGVTDIPEEIEINGTSLDATPPNAGLDAGALPTAPTVPSAALLPVTAAMMPSTVVPTTPNTPKFLITDILVTTNESTTTKKPVNEDNDEDESNNTGSVETINIIDPFYGGMRQDLVRNTNMIQDLINRLAVIEYGKNLHAMDKAHKKQQGTELVVNSVLNELVKLENKRSNESKTHHDSIHRRSTYGTTRQTRFTRSSTTPSPPVTTPPMSNSSYFLANNDTNPTASNDTMVKPLSIEDIHSFLHTLPNSNDILKRLADIFANNKSTPAAATSKTTRTTVSTTTTTSRHQTSPYNSTPNTSKTTRRVYLTSGVTKPTTIRVTKEYLVPEVTHESGLPARFSLTSVNGDISFGDESARRLNMLRIPSSGHFDRTNNHRFMDRMLKTTRKTEQLTTTTEKTVVTTPAHTAVFSLQNGQKNSHFAVYGTQVWDKSGQHHVKGHNKIDHIHHGPSSYQRETTVRFRPKITTSKTTHLPESRLMVTGRPGNHQHTTAAFSITMKSPTATTNIENHYRSEHLPGSNLLDISPFMPMFGQDIMPVEENRKRIEPNLNNIFSEALKIQSPNGMQIKQLPRAKRTSSGRHTIA